MRKIYTFNDGLLENVDSKTCFKCDLLYSICYYADRDFFVNIERQVSHAHSIISDYNTDLVFIAVCAFDDIDNRQHVENKLNEIYQKINHEKMKILFLAIPNWGGTIAALWYLWKDVLEARICIPTYVSHMEEDLELFSNSWLSSSIACIDQFIYVGETTRKAGEFKLTSQRGTTGGARGRTKLAEEEAWSDGGFYFTTVEKLKIMEDAIGIFHKGDQTTKFDHHLDGVDIGEVGFPTLLYHANLKFTTIARDSFFRHP